MTSDQYGLADVPDSAQIPAPELAYLPSLPAGVRFPIGLVGAGGISAYHLRAYRALDLPVTMICDLDLERARQRAAEFYPDAQVCADYRELLANPAVAVVDVATHPEQRLMIIEQALRAKKHVLSQKPFVLNLAEGRRLADLADAQNVLLAVNQNGRWAPHFSYMRHAVAAGVLGQLASIDFLLHWDHTWTSDTPFNEIHHLLLLDFGIHWFDLITTLLPGQTARQVYASVTRCTYQKAQPPFLASVILQYPNVEVRLMMNAHVVDGQEDRTVIAGEHGTVRAWGPGLNEQHVRLWTAAGWAEPALQGCWFENGFQGAMSELQTAIACQRQPLHAARQNLDSLQLCFAAMLSADLRQPVDPTTVHQTPCSPARP